MTVTKRRSKLVHPLPGLNTDHVTHLLPVRLAHGIGGLPAAGAIDLLGLDGGS